MKKLFFTKTKILLLSITAFLCFYNGYAQLPSFEWAKKVAGNSLVDAAISKTSDAAGNIYSTGYLNGTMDFDPGPGIFNLSPTGSVDIFISKSDASGNLVWAKKMGGTLFDMGQSIALDVSGNIYTTGFFEGTSDFDPDVTGIFNLTSEGKQDIFISKSDPSGNFLWAKRLGGLYNDEGRSIAIDASGNICLTGNFGGKVDFDPGAATLILATPAYNDADIFISKFDPSGNLLWAKNIGGGYDECGNSIAVDAAGNIYTAGIFKGRADFDPGAGNHNMASFCRHNSFILKLDASGNFVWAKDIGGSSVNAHSAANSIALDASGNVYTTGWFNGPTDFDPGEDTLSLTPATIWDNDVFILKLNAAGNFVWVVKMGGSEDDHGSSIAVDAPGNVLTTGRFSGTVDFDPGSGTFNLTSSGYNIFMHKMSQASLGIKDNTTITNPVIYPNPTNGILNVELDNLNGTDFKIQVLNSTGQKVIDEIAKPHSSFTIHHLPSGLYFVKVVSDNKIISTQKIVKQ